MLSSAYLISCSILVAVFVLIIKPVLSYVKDPLKIRKYPSPNLFAAITPLWLIWATWSQRRSRILHQEFKRLGDVIRVSPNHLIFNDPAAIKDIYGVLAISHGVAKDEFYDRGAGDAHDLVQLRDRHEHSERRKALANAFAAKTVVNMESVIRAAAHQLLQVIDKQIDTRYDSGYPINLRLWLNFFTLDVIGDTGFGKQMGFLQRMSDAVHAESHAGRDYEVSSTIEALHRGVRYSLTMANIPSLSLGNFLKSVVTRVSPLAEKLGAVAANDFEHICIRKLRSRIQNGPPARPSGDFMGFVLGDRSQSNDSEKGSLPLKQFQSLVADSVMMMNAGSDTTAAALTSTVWFLLNNEKALTRLRKELEPLIPPGIVSAKLEDSSIFDYDVVKDLPFLRACIDESLRLRPPIAYQLPRLVSRPVTIAGRSVLPGTVVAVAPYSVHRHPSLYRDPDEYRPERWVDFDEEYPKQQEHLKQYNVVFSQGSRACIGRHLAIVELQILMSTLFMRYDMSLADPKKRLDVFERFNSNPGPLYVKFDNRTATR